jgi:hypothetical protein
MRAGLYDWVIAWIMSRSAWVISGIGADGTVSDPRPRALQWVTRILATRPPAPPT